MLTILLSFDPQRYGATAAQAAGMKPAERQQPEHLDPTIASGPEIGHQYFFRLPAETSRAESGEQVAIGHPGCSCRRVPAAFPVRVPGMEGNGGGASALSAYADAVGRRDYFWE